MYARALTLVAMTSLSGCVLTTNEATHNLRVGMPLSQAEAILGEPTTVRDLGIIKGTTPAKNITRQCRTYRYTYLDDEKTVRDDRFTSVTYNSGQVANFHDNGYASNNGAYCHG